MSSLSGTSITVTPENEETQTEEEEQIDEGEENVPLTEEGENEDVNAELDTNGEE